MRRKGGMELSINAIVILIIAMVVLGIGILFIRGMFAKAQTTTFKALSSQETTNPASADRPLVADREVILSTTNPSATVSVSVYNTNPATVEGITIALSSCTDSLGGTVNIAPASDAKIGFTKVSGVSIPSNQFASYQTSLSMLKIAGAYPFSPGDALACTLTAKDTATPAKIDQSTSLIVKIQAAG